MRAPWSPKPVVNQKLRSWRECTNLGRLFHGFLRDPHKIYQKALRIHKLKISSLWKPQTHAREYSKSLLYRNSNVREYSKPLIMGRGSTLFDSQIQKPISCFSLKKLPSFHKDLIHLLLGFLKFINQSEIAWNKGIRFFTGCLGFDRLYIHRYASKEYEKFKFWKSNLPLTLTNDTVSDGDGRHRWSEAREKEKKESDYPQGRKNETTFHI